MPVGWHRNVLHLFQRLLLLLRLRTAAVATSCGSRTATKAAFYFRTEPENCYRKLSLQLGPIPACNAIAAAAAPPPASEPRREDADAAAAAVGAISLSATHACAGAHASDACTASHYAFNAACMRALGVRVCVRIACVCALSGCIRG